MFSKSCQYALQAMLYIALHAEGVKRVSLKDVSSSQNIPLHYLSKILQTLVRHGLLTSTKGPSGGFALGKSPGRVKLLHIVAAIDGLDSLNQCGIGLKECSDQYPCPIHEEYQKVKQMTRDLLSSKSLSAFMEDMQAGKSIVTI